MILSFYVINLKKKNNNNVRGQEYFLSVEWKSLWKFISYLINPIRFFANRIVLSANWFFELRVFSIWWTLCWNMWSICEKRPLAIGHNKFAKLRVEFASEWLQFERGLNEHAKKPIARYNKTANDTNWCPHALYLWGLIEPCPFNSTETERGHTKRGAWSQPWRTQKPNYMQTHFPAVASHLRWCADDDDFAPTESLPRLAKDGWWVLMGFFVFLECKRWVCRGRRFR